MGKSTPQNAPKENENPVQISKQYRDGDGKIDENQLADDISLCLSDLDEDRSNFDRVLNGIINEFMKRIEYTEKSDDVLFLDEPNELYGYGLFNTHEHEVTELCGDEEEAVQRFSQVSENLSSNTHIRVVEIRLSNKLDKKASEVANQ